MGSTADYWVGTTIAEGAFGTVVYGQHKQSRWPVAIKCVSKAVMARQPVTAIQLVQEQKILKRLNETTDDKTVEENDNSDDSKSPPFFVRLHASFHDAHCVYIVTELCLGGTLQDVLMASQHPPKGTTTASQLGWRQHYGFQILQALSALHEAGIVHCDLKPHNVLLTKHGRVKLADFGSAIIIVPLLRGPMTVHQPIPRGSPGYAAPELMQMKQSTDITVAADMWSLGCVLFALWMGVSPFEDSGSEALTVQKSQEYCTLQDDRARMAFLFPTTENEDEDDASDNNNNNNPGTSSADEKTGTTIRKSSNPAVPAHWKLLISSLLRPKPCERAGPADQDTRTKDGKLYPSLHQSDVWGDVDTTKNPSLLPLVPSWWIEQQNAEKDDHGLRDGAAGWSTFLV